MLLGVYVVFSIWIEYHISEEEIDSGEDDASLNGEYCEDDDIFTS